MNGWNERQRIHQVSCSMHSQPDGSEDFERVSALANQLASYARKLGFDVMSENVDRDEV